MKPVAPETPRHASRLRRKDTTPKRLDPPISKGAESHKIVPRSLASDLPEESLDTLSDLISTGSSSQLPDPTESLITSESASTVARAGTSPDPFAGIREEIEVDVDAVARKVLEDVLEIVAGNSKRLVFHGEVRIAVHCLMLLIGAAVLVAAISSREGEDDVWDIPPA